MSEQELAEHEIRSVVGALRLIRESRGSLTASVVVGILKEIERGIKQIATLSQKLEPGK